MPRLNLNRLVMFDAAARHLNFRMAACELNLTQGAVAQQVRALEEELGLKLFDRKARGLDLTQAGRTYHTRIQPALAIIDEATDALSPSSTRITLSLPPSLASKWFVSKLADFRDRHTDIELVTTASEQLSDFKTDGIDIAIRHGKPPFPGNVKHDHLSDLQLCAVCAPDYANPIQLSDFPNDLTGCTLIGDGHKYWEKMRDNGRLGKSAKIASFSHTALAIEAALAGQGIALVPDIMLDRELADGRLVVVWLDPIPQDTGYYIVYPAATKTRSTARDTVLSWLKQQKPAR
ncbi:LysR substrate-binding domain-containing protein [Labrenzia sp. PHM005]|uniref:LysR substrate-binding domain-containing protein n=1 Tax=Labrenzia sp. PHM005 TaxID=2590016 RepID=UPI00114054A4|nr:LysR substrate-binding domain-containing protein [Labrenzia sp. PHM005]QDG77181.1 LysR family transcriptional regulator [Labrenzia sp. PHM005]